MYNMLLRIFLFVCIATISEQLQCYECENFNVGSVTPGRRFRTQCGDFSDAVLATCPNVDDECITINAENDETGQSIHICGSPLRCNNEDQKVRNGIKISCKSCATDGCNIASSEVFQPNPEIDNDDKLQCYNCVDGPQSFLRKMKMAGVPPCNGFTDTVLQHCPYSSEVCKKTRIKFDDQVVTVHECGKTKEHCELEDDIRTKHLKMDCYSCDTHGCNTSSTITFSIYLIIAISALIVKIIYN